MRAVRVDFTGKVAVVTGGGSGIGRAICQEFARAGARVVCVDLDPRGGEETVAQIRREDGEAIFVQADVTRSEDVQRYVREAVERFGRIDAFANNAGWEGAFAPIVELPEEQFDRIMAINVRGVFLGLKYVLPVMIQQRSGAVVNTASIAAYYGSPTMVGYSASKHAVVGLTQTAALEVARFGVRVNAIAPGPVDTRLYRAIVEAKQPGQMEEYNERMRAVTPDQRLGEPQEIAWLVLFLSSDFARHINGATIVIDGGLTAQSPTPRGVRQ
ncbi:MAG: glucose 1-dehydrogenase [Armatimonadota bacterium]|nr:glucose 1-dehydrogenase [Armatimonadota bacterium]MDR7443568.1 glucose 1-dehydrogenase [Armatimonadota bacterium]